MTKVRVVMEFEVEDHQATDRLVQKTLHDYLWNYHSYYDNRRERADIALKAYHALHVTYFPIEKA